MVYKIYNLYLKIGTSLELIFINILFVSILFVYCEPAFPKVNNFERNLAYKYCDSIEKNLFKGLDNERILKYEYFFNSINKEALNEELKNMNNLFLEVETICSYTLSKDEKENFNNMVKRYLSNN